MRNTLRELIAKCRDYDADQDPNGAIGRSLTQRFYQKTGRFSIERVLGDYEIWKKIAVGPFPDVFPGERVQVVDLKRKFKELEKAGYPIESGWRHLNRKQAWAYLYRIRREFSSEL